MRAKVRPSRRTHAQLARHERDRPAAIAALPAAGANDAEALVARVVNAASRFVIAARQGRGDPKTTFERAAHGVLAAHRLTSEV